MTPSQARIDAALRLADADCALATAVDGGDSVPPALLQERLAAIAAYRAALPKPRTEAEVDADLARACRAAVESNQMCGALFIQYVRQLCSEPTAPEAAPDTKQWDDPRSYAYGAAQDDPAPEDDRPCGCEEAEALREKLRECGRLLSHAYRTAADLARALETTP